jgi:hypothetical protein
LRVQPQAHKTLTRAPGIAVKDFVRFGYGYDKRQQDDKFNGLLELRSASKSLMVQTSLIYGGAFSYCLPLVNNETGFLALSVRRGIRE